MARPVVVPDPIGPASGLNRIGAALVLVMAGLPLYLGTDLFLMLLRDDGAGSGRFPTLLVLILISVGLLLVALAVWLWFRPTRRGLWVTFRPLGFSVILRTIWGREKTHRIDWADVEEMKLVVVPRGGAKLGFRLTHPAAVEAGLVQPTTRTDALKFLVPRSITLPVALSDLGQDAFVARFIASAEASGFRIEKVSSRELIVWTMATWTVAPSGPSGD